MSVECDDEGEERGGERSTDLCFFLWEGGAEPSWSDEGNRIQNSNKLNRKLGKYKLSIVYFILVSISNNKTSHPCSSNHHYASSSFCASLRSS